MKGKKAHPRARAVGEVCWNLFLITAGSAVCAVGVNGVLIPQGFLSGGITGLAIGLHYLLPQITVPTLYMLLNIPLYLLAWRAVGRRFLLYSLAGTAIFSLALVWCRVVLPVENKILAALLAGLITGAGSGIILRSRGSAGGMDILSVFLSNRFSVRLGTSSLAFNAALLTGVAFLLSLDQALYTLLFIYATARVVNLVVSGLSQRKAVMIISDRWSEVAQEIMTRLNRGVTFLAGEGAYSGRKQQVVYTVIAFYELPRLKRLVRELDERAFVVVSDTSEVIGQRIGNQPHW